MDYANIFRRSWNIIWKNKFMLVLGFLAALGGGAGSGGGSNSNYSFNSNDFSNSPFDPAAGSEIAEQFLQIWPAIAATAIALLCLAVIVGIVLWLVRLTAEAGMIDAASRLDAGEAVSFGDAIGAGWRKLGRMIGLNIIVFGIVFVLLLGLFILGVVVFGASIATAVDGSNDPGQIFGSISLIVACICGLVCLLVPLMILLDVLYEFSQRAAVLEDNGVFASISRGWNVIKANLGQVIILLIMLLLLGLLVAGIVLVIFIPLSALTAAPILLRIIGGNTPQLVDMIAICGGILLMVIIGALIQATYVSFRSTVITLAYEEFTDKKILPGS